MIVFADTDVPVLESMAHTPACNYLSISFRQLTSCSAYPQMRRYLVRMVAKPVYVRVYALHVTEIYFSSLYAEYYEWLVS